MRKCDSITEIVSFMKDLHQGINSAYNGCYAMKFFHDERGRRIPFEETKGFRLFDFQVLDDNTLFIDQAGYGLSFKNHLDIKVSSRIYLQDLVMINVYDHQSDFMSAKGIDFSYIENTREAQIQMLVEWHGTPAEIRAQWVRHNIEIDSVLKDVGEYRKMSVPAYIGRNLDL